jgi:cytochrome c oxidase subunit IV
MSVSRGSILRIWAGLMAATAVTWWLGESGVSRSAGMTAVAIMFGLAFLKGRWIVLDFMELRHAPPLWKRLMLGWLAGVITVIVLSGWWGRG